MARGLNPDCQGLVQPSNVFAHCIKTVIDLKMLIFPRLSADFALFLRLKSQKSGCFLSAVLILVRHSRNVTTANNEGHL